MILSSMMNNVMMMITMIYMCGSQIKNNNNKKIKSVYICILFVIKTDNKISLKLKNK